MMHKTLLPIAAAILISGCSGSDDEPVKEQPITGAPPPTLTFSLSEITAPELTDVVVDFTTSDAGSNAQISIDSNQHFESELQGGTILLKVNDVSFHTVETQLSVDISFGGQRTTSTIPVNIRNDSGLVLVEQSNALFAGLSTLGEDDLALAVAVSEISGIEGVSLEREISDLNNYVLSLPTDSTIQSNTSLVIDKLTNYLEGDIDEAELARSISAIEQVFNSASVEQLNELMAPFILFLGDFTLSQANRFYYSPDDMIYSRYIGNPEFGEVIDNQWSFNENLSYLSFLLPSIVGITPCELQAQEGL